LRDRVEEWLAWQWVQKEISDGTLGGEFETSELREVASKVHAADEEARNEVWASYRFIAFADPKSPDGIKCVDLGAGHSSGAKSLCDRVLGALKSNASRDHLLKRDREFVRIERAPRSYLGSWLNDFVPGLH
jgi:hypothetical protein